MRCWVAIIARALARPHLHLLAWLFIVASALAGCTRVFGCTARSRRVAVACADGPAAECAAAAVERTRTPRMREYIGSLQETVEAFGTLAELGLARRLGVSPHFRVVDSALAVLKIATATPIESDTRVPYSTRL